MALIDIPAKGISGNLTNTEFNQLLDALKTGTRGIKTLDIEANTGTFTGVVDFLDNISVGGISGPYAEYFEMARLVFVGAGGGVYDGSEFDGKTPGRALRSFQDAIDNAEEILGFTPSRDNTIVVVCLDGSTYEEDISCVDWVDVHAPNAILKLGGVSENQLTLASNRVQFNKITRDVGTNDMIVATASTGESMLFANSIIDSGTGVTVHNRVDTSLYVRAERFEVLGDGGIGISDYGPGFHHGHYHINSLLVGNDNTIGIQNTGPGYSVGYVDAISYEFLPITNTKAFEIIDGHLSVFSNYVECHTAYELSGDAIFEIIATRIVGAKIQSTGTVFALTPQDFSEIDNTSDADKPISTATQAALDLKSDDGHSHSYEPANANIQSHIASVANPHMVDKADVGLSNVDNTSDADKPISTSTQSALDLKSDMGHIHTSFTTIQIGNVGGGNYTAFEADGHMALYGDATAWDDIAGDMLGRSLGSGIGTADYDWDNNSVAFEPNGSITDSRDRAAFTIQKPHKAKLDSSLNLHVHWEQIDTTSREFTLRYRIQPLGAIKQNAWTTVVVDTNTNNRFAYSTGTLNQITELASIDTTGYGISTQIQVQLTRTDAVAGSIHVVFVDFHYEIDTVGSRLEYAK